MLSGLQIPLFFIFSMVTFYVYHTIPDSLERMRAVDDLRRKVEAKDGGMVTAVVTSPMFTHFVRWCGNDHAVMALVMCGAAMGVIPIEWHGLAGWVLVVSAAIVAFVSAGSYLAIKAAEKADG